MAHAPGENASLEELAEYGGNVLLSGPAGAGKSAIARELVEKSAAPAVAADFQAIVVALTLAQRLPTGRYPVRPDWLLPLASWTKKAVIRQARVRGLRLVVTNSDGDPGTRREILELLGGDGQAIERIVDPGEDVVRARLAETGLGPESEGRLEPECDQAVGRWYLRRVHG